MKGSADASAGIELADVTKRFAATIALDNVSISVAPGEFFSLLGPSGCGKTTLLRIVGGFESPDSGTVRIGDADVTRLSPQSRPTAMVFQNYALFPHMTVGENVAYGLKVKRVAKSEVKNRVAAALAGVGMDALVDRPIAALSGGQQQRVALARAVAVEPRVLLFDEPLSNLDLALRDRTRTEIRRIQQSLGITSLYVTHDQIEAMAMSDRIAVMRSGRIEQLGTPQELFDKPETAFVASFLGSANIIADRSLAAELAGHDAPGPTKVLAIRPQSLTIGSSGAVKVRISSVQYLGAYREVLAELPDGSEVRSHVDPHVEIPSEPWMSARMSSWVDGGDGA